MTAASATPGAGRGVIADGSGKVDNGWLGFATITNSTMTLGAYNFVLDATTGTQWGTAASQKQAWWGAAPVVRPLGATQALLVDNVSGGVAATLAAIPDPADTPLTADALRDDLVANVLPKIRDAISSISAYHNGTRTPLVTIGLIKGSA